MPGPEMRWVQPPDNSGGRDLRGADGRGLYGYVVWDDPTWRATAILPPLTVETSRHPTEAEARAWVEAQVRTRTIPETTDSTSEGGGRGA